MYNEENKNKQTDMKNILTFSKFFTCLHVSASCVGSDS